MSETDFFKFSCIKPEPAGGHRGYYSEKVSFQTSTGDGSSMITGLY